MLFRNFAKVNVCQGCSIPELVIGCTTILSMFAPILKFIVLFIKEVLLELLQPCQYYQVQSVIGSNKEILLCTALNPGKVPIMQSFVEKHSD
jgi:hypothetical protein